FVRLLEEALLPGEPLAGVLHLWGTDAVLSPSASAVDLEAAVQRGGASCLHLAQALAKGRHEPAAGLWLLTRAAQAVGAEDNPTALAQAPLWGLGRVILR